MALFGPVQRLQPRLLAIAGRLDDGAPELAVGLDKADGDQRAGSEHLPIIQDALDQGVALRLREATATIDPEAWIVRVVLEDIDYGGAIGQRVKSIAREGTL